MPHFMLAIPILLVLMVFGRVYPQFSAVPNFVMLVFLFLLFPGGLGFGIATVIEPEFLLGGEVMTAGDGPRDDALKEIRG